MQSVVYKIIEIVPRGTICRIDVLVPAKSVFSFEELLNMPPDMQQFVDEPEEEEQEQVAEDDTIDANGDKHSGENGQFAEKTNPYAKAKILCDKYGESFWSTRDKQPDDYFPSKRDKIEEKDYPK